MFGFKPEKIIKKHDAKALCKLSCENFIKLSIALMYDHYCDRASSLNKEQRIVYLCMSLETACQADSLLSLTEDDDLFFALPEMYDALLTIGSQKTADELQKFIRLMPDDTFTKRIMPEWDWFFADEERNAQLNEIDSAISDYPDGLTGELLWKYCTVSAERAQLILADL